MSNQNPNIDDANADRPTVVSIHEHVADLLGAYAVHSVNDAESELVELHLEHCVLCQAELAQHFETAARLGAASVMPVAPRVWDNVLNEIRLTKAISAPAELSNPVDATNRANQWSLVSPEVSSPAGPTSQQLITHQPTASTNDPISAANNVVSNVVSNVADKGVGSGANAEVRKGRTWRVAVAAAVATAAITVPVVSRLSGSSFSLAAVAKRVASQPSSRSFTLKSETGSELAKVVVGQDGQGYLTSDSLPKLVNGKAYQLWAVTTSGPVSLGILGADPAVQAFATPQTYAALAISVEDAAGAAAPTPPVASAAV
jgi:Anti-sigma-K factor rskA